MLKIYAGPNPKEMLALSTFWGNGTWICLQTRTLQSVTRSYILHSSDQWILLQDAKFQPTRFLHQIKRSRICLSVNWGRSSGLRARYFASLSRFLSSGALVKGARLTSLSRFRFSQTDFILGLPYLGRSLTALVWASFCTNLVITLWVLYHY